METTQTNKGYGFRDLDVYATLMEALLIVNKQILPNLPESEKFGLADQLRRSSKSPIALLAEGYAKRKHHKSWLKYLEDCIGECNESIAHIEIASRLYANRIPGAACLKAIDLFDKASRQLVKLGQGWRKK